METKTQTIRVRLSPRQKKQVEKIVGVTGERESDILRTALSEFAKRDDRAQFSAIRVFKVEDKELKCL